MQNDLSVLKIDIKEEPDALHAQRLASPFLENCFSLKKYRDEVLLVIKELATNLERHAKGGVLILKKYPARRRARSKRSVVGLGTWYRQC